MKTLTVNRLALGNIRQRKKQYIMLIIGIILAMIFSSSITLLISGASESYLQSELNQIGKQNVILYYPEYSEQDYKQFKDKNVLSEYGFAHHIGYAYPDGNNSDGVLGAEVTWLDDKAKELSYQTFIEGSYPAKGSEIAAEETALKRLGYNNAKVGDTIKINLRIQNNNEYLDFVSKEYTLSGIAKDKKKRLETRSYIETDLADTLIPGFFVAQGTKTEAGGKEKLVAYCLYSDYYNDDKHYDERLDALSSIDENWQINDCERNRAFAWYALTTTSQGDLIIAVIAVLVFASCVAIVNAFNTNLKERKRQIGLLRAVGATKRQIIAIFGREALLISLITAPISIAISYVGVRIVLGFLYEEPHMTNSLLVLPITIALNILIVMLASLIPLVTASKITPMQAIRNIENTRQFKRKKIKSKRIYNPSKLIAKRSLVFSKGSRTAVCVLLSATIIVSCLGFSYISYMKENIIEIGADYVLAGMNYQDDFINFDTNMRGLTESERAILASEPEIETIEGTKRLAASVLIDDLSDYYKLMKADNYTWSRNYEQLSSQELKNKWLEMFKNGISDEADAKDYEAIKEALKVDKEIFNCPIITYEDNKINKLKGKIYDGRIDLDKLSVGNEVILVAPKEVKYYISKRNGGYYVERKYDGEKGKKSDEVAFAASDIKAGDTLNIIIGVVSSEFDDTAEHNKYTLLKKENKKVKIGAIISSNSVDGSDFGIITTNEGLNSIFEGVNYSDINIYTSDNLDDSANTEILEMLQPYQNRYGGSLLSNYDYVKMQEKQYLQLMGAVLIIIILGFIICASIINNSVSSRIRENKSVLGTLRAFGADAAALTRIYKNEMLSMFSFGVAVGYGAFAIVWIIFTIAKNNYGVLIEFIFNPWVSVLMTAILFIACWLNLRIKVKSEMKNSIVENIREL